MANMRAAIPPVVLIYGLLGVIPFLAPPVAGVLFPEFRAIAGTVLSLYAALILSFLGGARWGLAVATPAPKPAVVSLAMLPTLAGLALLMLPEPYAQARLLGLALALGLHWLWDIRGRGLPAWYASLRTILTAGAVIGLVAGALLLR
jgi:hypothetical protein